MKLRNTKLYAALAALGAFGFPAIGGPLTGLPQTLEIDGSNANPASLVALLNQLVQQGAQQDTANFQTTAGATLTLSSLAGLTQRFTTGGACTVTLDSAYNIVNNIQNPFLGQAFPVDLITIAATTVATPSLTDQTVTLSGTTSLAASTLRRLQGLVTQLNSTSPVIVTPGTTFTSLTQQGATNGYNVVTAANSVTPVVGQIIYINTTAGTLPVGWYPVVNVTTANAFRIQAPIAGVAWTATGATFPTVAVPAGGVFSPLLTLTSMWSLVTASA